MASVEEVQPRRDHVAVAAKSEAHADFAGKRSHGAAGNAEQADLLDVSAMPEPVLLLGKFLRAAARAQNHADLALFFHRHGGGIEAGILDRFGRGGDSQRHYAGDVFAFARVHPGKFVKLRNFAGDVPAARTDRSGRCVSLPTCRRERRGRKLLCRFRWG